VLLKTSLPSNYFRNSAESKYPIFSSPV
jgi:hypothetical protein